MRIRKGYSYYYIVYLTRKPSIQWPTIDKKILQYYQAHISKHARYYRVHKKQQKVFFYQRYKDVGIILATQKGNWPGNIKPELFHNIDTEPMVFRANTLKLLIWRRKDNKYDVKLTKDCIQSLKEKFYLNYISRFKDAKYRAHYKFYAQQEIQKILALPNFTALNNQKRDLLRFYRESFKRLKLKLQIPKKVGYRKKFQTYKKLPL